MKKILLIAAVLIIALSGMLVGCTKYPEAPEEVVKAYYYALVNLDYEGFKSFLSADFLEIFPKEEFEEQLSSSWEIQHFKELEITNVEIENDTARVEFIIYYDQQSSRYPDGMESKVAYLVKEQGQWKAVMK